MYTPVYSRIFKRNGKWKMEIGMSGMGFRNIGPGAVFVFTLGRTKKCAANQITVLKHVKLTCDSCSLRRVSTECVQSFTAPWQ